MADLLTLFNRAFKLSIKNLIMVDEEAMIILLVTLSTVMTYRKIVLFNWSILLKPNLATDTLVRTFLYLYFIRSVLYCCFTLFAAAKRTTGRMQQRNTQSRGGRGQGKTHQQAAENLSLAARNKMANLRAKLNSRNGMNKRQDRGKSDRLPSLAVGADWELIDEFDLSQLLKLAANPPQVEDLAWCGFVDQYDDAYDKLTTRLSKNIKRQENKIFYDVTTSDDPILEKFAVDELADIYATDSIIAQLMASPRSVYPWDIVVQKVNGMIFLDKRENSSFDYLTVSETALEPPSSGEDVEVYNYPDNLAIEATMINQNFTQQILVDNDETRKTVSSNLIALSFSCTHCYHFFPS